MAWNTTARKAYKRPDNYCQKDLTDAEWAIVEPMIPRQGRMGRPRHTSMRRIFDAIQYMLAAGCQWRLIPSCYPPFSTIQNYFYSWSRSWVLEDMLDAPRRLARQLAGRAKEPTAAAIDSQNVVARLDMTLANASTAANATCWWIPIVMNIHRADLQDRDGALEVIAELVEKAPQVKRIWADGGYRGPKLAASIQHFALGTL